MDTTLNSNKELPEQRTRHWRYALILAGITIVYNLAEGLVSMYFGATDEMLTLFGFGMDSFAEVLSGAGILHLVFRSKGQAAALARDGFERTALRITGFSFYVLAIGMILGAVLSIWSAHKPDGTVPGLIVSALSIATMYFLYRAKIYTGGKLDSSAIIADARCTLSCLYLSYILFAASAIYALFHIPYIDALGSLALAFYVIKEGRATFNQARPGAKPGCSDECC